MDRGILCSLLDVSVPNLIERVQRLPESYITEKMKTLPSVSALADDIVNNDDARAVARSVFSLTEVLAYRAFDPGGVQLFTCHFEARHKAVVSSARA